MKYLIVALLLIALYELSDTIIKDLLKNRRNKYLCRTVSERHPQKERAIYERFIVFSHSDGRYDLFLEETLVATWFFDGRKAYDICVENEGLFNSLKNILENN